MVLQNMHKLLLQLLHVSLIFVFFAMIASGKVCQVESCRFQKDRV